MTDEKKKGIPPGWMLVIILVTLYFGFKCQGWLYEFQAQRFGREVEMLRPSLFALLKAEQMGRTAEAYEKAFQQIRAGNLDAVSVMRRIAVGIPPSVTLQEVDMRAPGEMLIEGSVMAGVRSPEEALLPWARQLQDGGARVRIKSLFPETRIPGLWRFQLKLEQGDHA
ncbi:MAG: hypothetical protein NC819_02685 [Candidatus Omnitrophica bacterium]|nr:hypothetical protein [Candidatus Omnitrophota bacterium]